VGHILRYVDVRITVLEIIFMNQVNAYLISFGNIHPFMVILHYLFEYSYVFVY